MASLSLNQLKRLPVQVLELHLHSCHLTTSGTVADRARRLYDHYHAPAVPDPNSSILDTVREMLAQQSSNMETRFQAMLDASQGQATTHQLTSQQQPVMQQPDSDEDNISDTTAQVPRDSTPGPAHTPTPPAASQAIPPVPAKLQNRILKGEYIDFKELLPENMFSSGDVPLSKPNSVTLQLDTSSALTTPQITVTNPGKHSKRTIDTFHAWMQAWNAYVAVLATHFPSRALEMLAYQRVITDAANEYLIDRWYDYDKRFRHTVSTDRSLKWDRICTDLWLECLTPPASTSDSATRQAHPGELGKRPCTYCRRTTHFPHTCPQAPWSFRSSRLSSTTALRNPLGSGTPRSTTNGKPVCWNYNGTGACNKPACTYSHTCGVCGGNHPAKGCRRRAPN